VSEHTKSDAMTARGPGERRVEFGISVAPLWAEQAETQRLVLLAEDAGLDLVGIQDHPYQWRFHDTWTLISFLAATTKRIRFFPDVVNLPLRPPAMLAKAAASLDVLTGGRIELGLGAGGFLEAAKSMGAPERKVKELVETSEEAIDVIRLVWSGQRNVSYSGRHYHLSGVNTGPAPVHDMGIWVGATGPRMLDLVGRKADGWVPSSPWAPPEELPRFLERIAESAAEAGREPGSVKNIYNVAGRVGSASGEPLVGPVSYWVDQVGQLTEMGIDAFVFWPVGGDAYDQVELFASEVAPAARAAIHQ
jgi:alkanesulfonate monooxygenase SsuD/methylene tetrahydromethanopterin reductase-like flavin-dependent oxidoreductase (luciferase family)